MPKTLLHSPNLPSVKASCWVAFTYITSGSRLSHEVCERSPRQPNPRDTQPSQHTTCFQCSTHTPGFCLTRVAPFARSQSQRSLVWKGNERSPFSPFVCYDIKRTHIFFATLSHFSCARDRLWRTLFSTKKSTSILQNAGISPP